MNKINYTILLCLISVIACAGTKNDSLRIVVGISPGYQYTDLKFNHGLYPKYHSTGKNYWSFQPAFHVGIKPLRNVIILFSYFSNKIYFGPEEGDSYYFPFEMTLYNKSTEVGIGYIFTHRKFYSELSGGLIRTRVRKKYPTRILGLDFNSVKAEMLVGVNLHHHVIAAGSFFIYNLNQNMVDYNYYNSTISFSKSYGFNLTYRFYFLKK